MEKISVSNVVAFRKKSTASQITLINNLRKPKPPIKDENGKTDWKFINIETDQKGLLGKVLPKEIMETLSNLEN
jgi:hypothetical protein